MWTLSKVQTLGRAWVHLRGQSVIAVRQHSFPRAPERVWWVRFRPPAFTALDGWSRYFAPGSPGRRHGCPLHGRSTNPSHPQTKIPTRRASVTAVRRPSLPTAPEQVWWVRFRNPFVTAARRHRLPTAPGQVWWVRFWRASVMVVRRPIPATTPEQVWWVRFQRATVIALGRWGRYSAPGSPRRRQCRLLQGRSSDPSHPRTKIPIRRASFTAVRRHSLPTAP